MKPTQEIEMVHGTDCRPVKDILARIGSKWAVMIVMRLMERPMRFNELKREAGGITQKVLTEMLRELERDGFVKRTVTASMPPRVDYELTDLGRDLYGPIQALGEWAVANRPRIEAARAAYDVGQSAGTRQVEPHVVIG